MRLAPLALLVVACGSSPSEPSFSDADAGEGGAVSTGGTTSAGGATSSGGSPGSGGSGAGGALTGGKLSECTTKAAIEACVPACKLPGFDVVFAAAVFYRDPPNWDLSASDCRQLSGNAWFLDGNDQPTSLSSNPVKPYDYESLPADAPIVRCCHQ